MLYFPLKGYEEFKELFGLRVCGNGEKTRKNKILLAYWKSLFKETVRTRNVYGISYSYRFNYWQEKFCTCMNQMYIDVIKGLEHVSGPREHTWVFPLNQRTVLVNTDLPYEMDDCKGICTDGDILSIRYKNLEAGGVFKMKASRMFSKFLNESLPWLPQQVSTWMCEEFHQRWQAWVSSRLPNKDNLELRLSDSFAEIYDSNCHQGDFHSCMDDGEQYYFYENAVKAKAAYLVDKDAEENEYERYMVARCVVFTDVRVDGKDGFRVAERQYSSDGDECLKRILVDKLIEAGEIDAYKTIGASCHDGHAFVGVDGTSWQNKSLSIRCNLDDGDTLSYQDSFKYYVYPERRAYNFEPDEHWCALDTTDGDFCLDGENYDSYHDCYTSNDVVTVYVGDTEETCDEECLDDFRWVESLRRYQHEDDLRYCEECGEYVLDEDALYSEVTDCYYCCEDCLEEAEESYKEDNWYWSDLLEEYFETEDERDEEEEDYKSSHWHWSDLTEEYYKTEEERDKAEDYYKEDNGWLYCPLTGDYVEDKEDCMLVYLIDKWHPLAGSRERLPLLSIPMVQIGNDYYEYEINTMA